MTDKQSDDVLPAPERIWTCKIGGPATRFPQGADAPMRNAVRDAFALLTGADPEFIFSGWGGELTEPERAVVENRLPSREWHEQQALAAQKAASAGEPVARIVSSGPHDFPLLEWLSADHSFRAPIGSVLFAAAPTEPSTPTEREAEQAEAPSEPMRAHVEKFAAGSGWVKDDGEGAFEFVQRKCYHQGWQDGRREALGDVHRDTPEVATQPTASGAGEREAEQAEAPSEATCERCGIEQSKHNDPSHWCDNQSFTFGAVDKLAATQPTASNAGEREAFNRVYDQHCNTPGLTIREIAWRCFKTAAALEALASKPPAGELAHPSAYLTGPYPDGHVKLHDYDGVEVARYVVQPEQVAQDSIDAERWRAFIGLEYKVRAEWACNLSLAPVLTEWVDQRAARARGEGELS